MQRRFPGTKQRTCTAPTLAPKVVLKALNDSYLRALPATAAVVLGCSKANVERAFCAMTIVASITTKVCCHTLFSVLEALLSTIESPILFADALAIRPLGQAYTL